MLLVDFRLNKQIYLSNCKPTFLGMIQFVNMKLKKKKTKQLSQKEALPHEKSGRMTPQIVLNRVKDLCRNNTLK